MRPPNRSVLAPQISDLAPQVPSRRHKSTFTNDQSTSNPIGWGGWILNLGTSFVQYAYNSIMEFISEVNGVPLQSRQIHVSISETKPLIKCANKAIEEFSEIDFTTVNKETLRDAKMLFLIAIKNLEEFLDKHNAGINPKTNQEINTKIHNGIHLSEIEKVQKSLWDTKAKYSDFLQLEAVTETNPQIQAANKAIKFSEINFTTVDRKRNTVAKMLFLVAIKNLEEFLDKHNAGISPKTNDEIDEKIHKGIPLSEIEKVQKSLSNTKKKYYHFRQVEALFISETNPLIQAANEAIELSEIFRGIERYFDFRQPIQSCIGAIEFSEMFRGIRQNEDRKSLFNRQNEHIERLFKDAIKDLEEFLDKHDAGISPDENSEIDKKILKGIPLSEIEEVQKSLWNIKTKYYDFLQVQALISETNPLIQAANEAIEFSENFRGVRENEDIKRLFKDAIKNLEDFLDKHNAGISPVENSEITKKILKGIPLSEIEKVQKSLWNIKIKYYHFRGN